MAHEWKFGDWGRVAGKHIVRFIGKHCAWDRFVYSDGKVMDDGTGTVEHLPDCTGFDWEPPKQIEPPEGYRLVTKGNVAEGDLLRAGDGNWYPCLSIGHSIAFGLASGGPANAYARKIEPKYRPFANAAEFAPYRDKWVRRKELKDTVNESLVNRVHTYSDTAVWIGAASVGKDYQEAFELLEFEDGSPFGVKE